jgi:hypothetical protein
MADADNNSSGLLKWIGGIAASVITAVLIYYLTRPTPTPPVIEPTALNGVVADSVSHQLIPNASVTVALGQNSAHQSTDELGRYSVVLASIGPDANMGSVDIQAQGYVTYTNTVALRPGDNYAEITIDAVPPRVSVAVPPAQPASPSQHGKPTGPAAAIPAHPALVPHAQILLKAPPPGYTKAATIYAGVKPK